MLVKKNLARFLRKTGFSFWHYLACLSGVSLPLSTFGTSLRGREALGRGNPAFI